MTRALAILATCAILAGCTLPGFPDCRPKLATLSWEQRAIYDALADPGALRMSDVQQQVLSPGIPFEATNAANLTPSVLRELRWIDPPLPEGTERELHITRTNARQGNVYRPSDAPAIVSFGFFPADAGAEAALDRFLAGVFNAPQEARDALALQMRTTPEQGGEMRGWQATTDLPIRADALWHEERPQHYENYLWAMHARSGSWLFVFDLAARSAEFPDAAYRLRASPSGHVGLEHGEGNSRFPAREPEAMRWANASFPEAGLPAPEFQGWRAEYATCI